MTVSVVIPFGADLTTGEGQHRARVWAFILPMWLDLMQAGVVDDLVVADDPLRGRCVDHPHRILGCTNRAEWSTARALRAGVPRTIGDIIVQYGADHIPDAEVITRAVTIMTTNAGLPNRTYEWTHLYRDVAYATEESTLALLDGAPVASGQPDGLGDLEWGARAGCCVGMWAFTRRAWEETGGVDPRFVGWGYGDDAWNRVLEATYGPSPAPPGNVLRELWHPAAYRDASAENPNQRLYGAEYAPIVGDKAALLAMQERWAGQ